LPDSADAAVAGQSWRRPEALRALLTRSSRQRARSSVGRLQSRQLSHKLAHLINKRPISSMTNVFLATSAISLLIGRVT